MPYYRCEKCGAEFALYVEMETCDKCGNKLKEVSRPEFYEKKKKESDEKREVNKSDDLILY